MKHLINIGEQEFYYASIDSLGILPEEQITLIIDENGVNNFVEVENGQVGSCVNQIIVIADNTDALYEKYKDHKVLLISAISISDAIDIAVNGVKISPKVLCVSNQESSEYFHNTLENFNQA